MSDAEKQSVDQQPHRYQGYADGRACYVCGLTRENQQMHPPLLQLTEDIREHVGPVSKSDNLRLAETIYGKDSKQAQEVAKVKRRECSHKWHAFNPPSDRGKYVCKECGYVPKPDSKLYHEAESILHLRSVLNPGDTVYTVLRHVSRSGMSRNIDLYYMTKDDRTGACVPIWISAYVGHAIGSPQSMKNWRASQGLTVGGCGMDMGFHLVYGLSRVLFPSGFACAGDRCPSNDHSNEYRKFKDYKGQMHTGDGGYALNHKWL